MRSRPMGNAMCAHGMSVREIRGQVVEGEAEMEEPKSN